MNTSCQMDAGVAYCLLDRYFVDMGFSCEIMSWSMNTAVKVVTVTAIVFGLVKVLFNSCSVRDEKKMITATPISNAEKKEPQAIIFTMLALSILMVVCTGATSSFPSWISSYWNDELQYCLKYA